MTEELLFQKALALVLENEGGHLSAKRAEEIGDPGGETFCGITANTLAMLKKKYPGRFESATTPIRLTSSQVMLAYRLEYWPNVAPFYSCAPMAVAFMDACVQHGAVKAFKLLQRAVGVAEDGEWGRNSRDAFGVALEELGELGTATFFVATRERFLLTWAKLNPKRRAQVSGFKRRMERVRRAIQAVHG